VTKSVPLQYQVHDRATSPIMRGNCLCSMIREGSILLARAHYTWIWSNHTSHLSVCITKRCGVAPYNEIFPMCTCSQFNGPTRVEPNQGAAPKPRVGLCGIDYS